MSKRLRKLWAVPIVDTKLVNSQVLKKSQVMCFLMILIEARDSSVQLQVLHILTEKRIW